MRVINEEFLRAAKLVKGSEFVITDDDIFTPMAKDFIEANKIRLVKQHGKNSDSMPVDVSFMRNGRIHYINAMTGAIYKSKPEDMTHIRGNLLVKKNHPRIVFRGTLEYLEAKIMETQVIAAKNNAVELVENLQELFNYVCSILAAEVKETPFEIGRLLGYDSKELRHVSHNPKEYFGIEHPVPKYTMGEVAVWLNTLRTEARKAELQAVNTFQGKRNDIVEALNRLSSAVYILLLKHLTGR